MSQRAWTLPFKFFTDLGFCINNNLVKQAPDLPGKQEIQKLFPQSGSISLSKVTDFAINGATGNLPQRDEASFSDFERKFIWTNEDMNQF